MHPHHLSGHYARRLEVIVLPACVIMPEPHSTMQAMAQDQEQVRPCSNPQKIFQGPRGPVSKCLGSPLPSGGNNSEREYWPHATVAVDTATTTLLIVLCCYCSMHSSYEFRSTPQKIKISSPQAELPPGPRIKVGLDMSPEIKIPSKAASQPQL